ncbi:MAG: hypothetical protein AB7K71_31745 [Polyangiaceae bacterium]
MKRLVFGCLLVAILPACIESSDSGDSAGTGGAAGSLGNSSGGTAGDPSGGGAPTAFDLLLECAKPVDLRGTASYGEDSTVFDDGYDQVLVALRDQVPGNYTLDRLRTHGQGSDWKSDVLVVRDDGSVIHSSAYGSDWDDWSGSTPVEVCSLREAAFIQSCIDGLSSPETDCMPFEGSGVLAVLTGCRTTQLPTDCSQ